MTATDRYLLRELLAAGEAYLLALIAEIRHGNGTDRTEATRDSLLDAVEAVVERVEEADPR